MEKLIPEPAAGWQNVKEANSRGMTVWTAAGLRGFSVFPCEQRASDALFVLRQFSDYNRGVQPLLRERKGDFMANKANDLAHTKWMCKYHIVFTPKYKQKVIYNQLKDDIRDILK